MRPGGGTGIRNGFKNRGSNEIEGSSPSRANFVVRKHNPFDKRIKKIYGPYIHESSKGPPRRRIIIVFVDGSKTTMSFSRWKMIQHLKRHLLPGEHVDHINENPLDDRISNLQLLSVAENNRKTNLGKPSPFKGIEKGWQHGTVYGYMKKKCKCKKCQATKVDYNKTRNACRRKLGGYGPRWTDL